MSKIYQCCVCHKQLKEKPVRLIKQEYGTGNYKQYAQVDRYDICQKCYISFDRWICKRKEGE